jgi:hypothetical protein
MLFLQVAACLFLATVEILLAGGIVMFLQRISAGRESAPKNKAGRKPGLGGPEGPKMSILSGAERRPNRPYEATLTAKAWRSRQPAARRTLVLEGFMKPGVAPSRA